MNCRIRRQEARPGAGYRNRSIGLRDNSRGRGRDHLGGLGALTEAVLEAAVHVAEVAHAPGSSRASPLALSRPVERAFAGTRVAAACALLLLDVVRATTTAHTQRVCLAGPLSK